MQAAPGSGDKKDDKAGDVMKRLGYALWLEAIFQMEIVKTGCSDSFAMRKRWFRVYFRREDFTA